MSAQPTRGAPGTAQRFEADLLLTLTTVIAAAGWIFSKEALAGLPPLIFIGLRFLIAGLVLAAFSLPQLRALNARSLRSGLLVGSLFAGAWVGRYRSKHVLALMYGSRALLIAGYLLMPPTEWTFYLFAAGLGFTWLATVPPTAAIVGKLFGTRYLATLFGLTLLSHQIGGFLGAWLGGLALSEFGDFTWMWYADMALALAAALLNLPIREARVQPLQTRAA